MLLHLYLHHVSFFHLEGKNIDSQLKSPSRLLLGLPKSIMSHTYSTVTSKLARYDLMEQDIDIHISGDYNIDDDDNDDDAFVVSNNRDIYALTDQDDADISNNNTSECSSSTTCTMRNRYHMEHRAHY